MPHLSVILATAIAITPLATLTTSSVITESTLSAMNSTIKKPLKKSVAELQKDGIIILAQKYGGDPHGSDPHGDDPHDEVHDSKLPANKAKREHKATKDVYGDTIPNTQAPY